MISDLHPLVASFLVDELPFDVFDTPFLRRVFSFTIDHYVDIRDKDLLYYLKLIQEDLAPRRKLGRVSHAPLPVIKYFMQDTDSQDRGAMMSNTCLACRLRPKYSYQVVKLYLESEIDLSQWYGKYALEGAVDNGVTRIVKLLLEHGVRPDDKMHIRAIKRGYKEITDLLESLRQSSSLEDPNFQEKLRIELARKEPIPEVHFGR